MRINSRYKWYIVDIIVFGALNYLAWQKIGNNVDLLAMITPFKLLLFGLATYRTADVISTESVTEIVRAPFMKKMPDNDSEHEQPKDRGFKGFFGRLIGCPSCMGVWVAMALFYGYIFLPTATSAIIIIMALTALERFASKIYNFFDNMEKH